MIRATPHQPSADTDQRPVPYDTADLLADLQRLVELGLVRPTRRVGGTVRYEITDPAAVGDDAA